ncbi:YHS domain-containing (seleno)protein [Flagellimonas sp. CMM7]|uniref:YHS domain-containing (seleno)protein n=1 Tax=Flagellimonas sp. CMM7 TaxID=2654676 RepID=UPI0013D0B765|nr:YHS domain-containing (seleno)protein [Flagellimonas sp. CMM7]UII80324.1 YHS domain-containing protein [Flagellimonas sp. CMM7]
MRKTTILVITILMGTLGLHAQKCKQPYPVGKHLVNTDEAGNNIAMESYDILTFFDNDPKKGSPDFSSNYEGINYLFSSAENKSKFDDAPTRYLPQYGGFCAVAAYFNKVEELQTYSIYQVVDGKLYFNKNEKAHAVWVKKKPEKIIKRADKNWNCLVVELGLDINEPYVEPASIK